LLLICLGLIFGLSVFSLIAIASFAAEPSVAKLPTLTFDGQTLNLAWEGGVPDAPIREYLPAGETLDTWHHLASIREYADLDNPAALAGKKLDFARQSYPNSPTNISTDSQTGEATIDFVAWPADQSFIEFNVFKYAKRPAAASSPSNTPSVPMKICPPSSKSCPTCANESSLK
jgi:hypothetical protein